MNSLSHATSPYLLQHRHNPVDWQEWGEAALARARDEGRPILLSVGYAACHWCHVMERESFEDHATAEVMNALFVCIKVDREERPDVDQMYMSALHALGEQGGWPMTMFLTSEAAPFWGGTYFPKEARYGRPAFTDVLRQVARIYAGDPGRIAQNAEVLTRAAQAPVRARGAEIVGDAVLDIATKLLRAMDPVEGGLNGAPKFPNVPILSLLWQAGVAGKESRLRDGVTLTLRKMTRGGIFDQIGGGFARYSTDDHWLVPHFEKMLYDNALIVDLLAQQVETGAGTWARDAIARTVAWLAREMTAPDGTFFSSLDADSDGVEGRFYIWTPDEIMATLGEARGAAFCKAYDISLGGNWHDEATGAPVSIPNRSHSAGPEDDAAFADDRAALLATREGRVRPGLDDKVLTDWNGMMIAALARAAAVCDEPAWRERAARAFAALIASADRGTAGEIALPHSRRDGRTMPVGFAADHAAMLLAAMTLYETAPAAERATLVETATRLATTIERHFWTDALGLCMTRAETDTLVRLAPTADDAVPNAHALWHRGLTLLAALPGQERSRARLDTLERHIAAAIAEQPTASAAFLASWLFRAQAAEIVIAGPDAETLAAVARAWPSAERILIFVAEEADAFGDAVALAQWTAAGAAAAYVCRDQACSPPLTSAATLRAALPRSA